MDVQDPVRLAGRLSRSRTWRLSGRDYRGSLPTPEDVLLLIEVADTSLAYDRGVKLPIHAEAGIREFCVVGLTGGTIERHTDPSGYSYRLTARAGRSEPLRSEALPDLALETDAVLG